MNFGGFENPSGGSSRRKEALINLSPTQRRHMEPPYVGCHEILL